MKFVYPWMLVLVAVVPVAGALLAFLRARTEKHLAAFVAPALQARLLPRHPRLFSLQAVLLLAGLALVFFATSRPQWGRSEQKTEVRSRNVVIALDVSRSMLAEDVRPNRL
jgi:Ca-activated chloride channel family protein